MEMQKPIMRSSRLFPLLLLSFLLCTNTILNAQIDPHYKNLFVQAEELFHAGDYQEAIKKLNISLFGLRSDNALTAKSYVYLGLCFYYLQDKTKSEEYLKEAEKYLGENGFLGLGLSESDVSNLENIWYIFHPRTSIFPGRTEPPPAPEPAPLTDKEQKALIARLDGRIKSNPKQISLYYELLDLYIQRKDLKKAKKTLENLMKNNPIEINAYYHMGKVDYERGYYKDAVRSLESFIQASERLSLDPKLTAEAHAYLIICLHHDGERGKALQKATDSLNIVTSELISALSILDQDKIQLRQIMQDVRKVERTNKERTSLWQIQKIHLFRR